MTPEQQQLLQSVIEQALRAHEASQSIDWGKVLETGVGTSVGALIALAGLFFQSWLSHRAKLREEKRSFEFTLQQWFENEYIDNGVMALYERVLRLNSQSLKALTPSDVARALHSGDDTTALRRCQEILGENVIRIWNMLERLHTILLVDSQAKVHEHMKVICSLLMTELPRLRDALVVCHVRSKSDIQRLKNSPSVIVVRRDFESKAEKIFSAAKSYLDSRGDETFYVSRDD